MLTLIVLVSAFAAGSQAAVINRDPRYSNWLRGAGESQVRIPVYIEQTRYASDMTGTVANIRAAMTALNTDLNGCINFYEVASPSMLGRDFIWVSPAFQNGSNSQTCAAVPGRQVAQLGNGQKLNIIPGTGAGQCGGSVRQIMAKFANALGLRNEYQRCDRPFPVDATKADPTIAQLAADMYKCYSSGIVSIFGPTAFDYNSITMIPGTTNAVSGQSIFTVPSGSPAPTQNRLSQIDCVAIVQQYACPIFCQNREYQIGEVGKMTSEVRV